MLHNPALSTKNVRTACTKLTWNIKVTGNAKPSTIRDDKARKVKPAIVIYRGDAAQARYNSTIGA